MKVLYTSFYSETESYLVGDNELLTITDTVVEIVTTCGKVFKKCFGNYTLAKAFSQWVLDKELKIDPYPGLYSITFH